MFEELEVRGNTLSSVVMQYLIGGPSKASNDGGKSWLVLREHQNDDSLKSIGATHTWPIQTPLAEVIRMCCCCCSVTIIVCAFSHRLATKCFEFE